MKALIVVGGYRKKNTWHMAEAFSEGLMKIGYEVESIYLKNYNVKHCTGCEGCYRTGKCVIKDEMTELYEKIDNSKVIVLASPLYFYMVSGDMKTFIDRGQPFWERTHRRKETDGQNRKIGVFLACNGGRYGHDDFFATYKPLRTYFGSIGAEYLMNYYVSETDARPVMERPDVLEEIAELGTKVNDGKKYMIHV